MFSILVEFGVSDKPWFRASRKGFSINLMVVMVIVTLFSWRDAASDHYMITEAAMTEEQKKIIGEHKKSYEDMDNTEFNEIIRKLRWKAYQYNQFDKT